MNTFKMNTFCGKQLYRNNICDLIGKKKKNHNITQAKIEQTLRNRIKHMNHEEREQKTLKEKNKRKIRELKFIDIDKKMLKS